MRTSVERALRGLLWDKVPRNHRQDPRPFLVRKVVTAVFVVIGAAVSAGARAAAARASDARWSPSTSPAAAARATRSVSVTMALCDGVSTASG